MRERFVDFVFERPVPSFKFRKMGLHRHVAFLLGQIGCLTQKVYTKRGWNFDARLGCATQQSPMSYYNASDALAGLKSGKKSG